VRRPHGVAGEVSVEVFTDFPEKRFEPGSGLLWKRETTERSLAVASVRPQGDRLLVRFDGVEDADAARALAGGELSIPQDDAVAPPEDFFYGHEVEGWRCEDRQGRTLGVARRVELTAGGPMLLVDSGRSEPVSIPFVRPLVVSADRGARLIVLDPPEGLMDL
jgi:16S rRNA processing protein RimM